jgi:hypothetical protein
LKNSFDLLFSFDNQRDGTELRYAGITLSFILCIFVNNKFKKSMKKIYIALFGVLVAGSLNAQLVTKPAIVQKKTDFGFEKAKPSVVYSEKVALWENDFSTASDWVMTNTSDPALDWSITTDLSAIPVAALRPAGFTSAANGYALIDSDAAGNSATQNANMTYSGTIDLSAYQYVSLVFQHSYRTYLDTRIVRVSNDGGTTWTDFVITSGTETTGVNTANPETYSLDISAVAGNQSNVKIQFNYQGNWGWYWAIDDVKIVETDDYDLQLSSIYWGTTGAWGDRLPYYQIPTSQVAPIDFSGIAKNIGVQTQSDIVFTATTTGYTGTSAQYALTATQSDTLHCTTAFTPAATVGNNVINFAVSSGATDANPANNTRPPLTIAVTNSIFARDASSAAAGGLFNQGNGYEMGNIFDIQSTATLSAIDVMVGSNSVAGSEIFVKLYSINASTGEFEYVEESFPYNITAANLGQRVVLPLITPATLNAGEPYLAVVGTFGSGGVGNDLVTGSAGTSAPQTTFFLDMTNNTWYYMTSTPQVRLNFSAASISELSTSYNMNVFPNPANANTTLSFELNNEAQAAVSVTDLAGKVVFTQALGTVNGSQNVTLNTESLTNGVYMVNLSVNGTVSTQKLVIRK